MRDKEVNFDENLSDNIYYLASYEMGKDFFKKSLYTFFCAIASQTLIGNEKTLKLTIPVSLTTMLISCVTSYFNVNGKPQYKKTLEKLDDVTSELILLGYDLDNNALRGCTIYTDDIIEFSDKYNNKYYIEESYSKDNNTKYYLLANSDALRYIKDESLKTDITNEIKRGLCKNKIMR